MRRRRPTANTANTEPRSASAPSSGMRAGDGSPFAANPDTAAWPVALQPGSAQAKVCAAATKPSLFGVSTPAAVGQGAPVSVSVKLIVVAASVNPPLVLRLKSKFPKVDRLPGVLLVKLGVKPAILFDSVTG